MLDAAEGGRQRLGLAVVELDVVCGGGSGSESDGGAHNEGDGFGFCLADGLGLGALVRLVQELMGQLVDGHRELFCGCQPGPDADPAAA